jgi:hypothetical protein
MGRVAMLFLCPGHQKIILIDTQKRDIKPFFFFFLPFPALCGVGTTCFSSCCDKESAIIFTTGRLPDVNLTLRDIKLLDIKPNHTSPVYS